MEAKGQGPSEGLSEKRELPAVKRIEGGLVFTGERFHAADVVIGGETFSAVVATSGVASNSASDPATIDATGCYVIPGLVDIHFHGCKGADLCDGTPEALATIAAYEASRGVTAICPASMTFPFETLAQAFGAAAAFAGNEADGMAALVGVNMEGPYISPEKVGAQNPAFVRGASIEEFDRLQEVAGGLIRLVDVAPEVPGNLEFVERIAGAAACGAAAGAGSAADGMRPAGRPPHVSIAHTCADYACAAEAFERGARHMTHLFNAMPGLHHRKPGPIAAAAERDDVTVELICDGIHVHPAMVRLAFDLFGRDRVCLISDTMRACGLEDGTYDLGGQDVTVRGPRATLADGTLAGSVSDLMRCLACSVQEMETPLEDAVRAATINPARAIGIDTERGSIARGKIADAVVLGPDLEIRHVVVRGKLLK